MAEESRSLRNYFLEAESKRRDLEFSWDTNTSTFQEKLTSAITTYEQCLKAADQISLFSSNETLDDISSNDLQYLIIEFHLAELVLKITGGDRKSYLNRSRTHLERFLKRLDSYDILSKTDSRLYQKYEDAPDAFSTASTTDAAARRDIKIARFREEKELKKKLEHLQQNPSALQNDEAATRDFYLSLLKLSVHQTFQALESIAQELHVLSLAPPPPEPGKDARPLDLRDGDSRSKDGYSERLDLPITSLTGNGPILSKDGKPLRPFTLLDNRQRLQAGVFRPDHSLPTMTIDEYLEEEKRRGGIIEGGGEQSGLRPEPDEDNMDKADEETMKARAWDEFVEANPKGSGNTMNRG
ncbi:type 2A phosphatase-associated protein 42 [Patellaria atrata CBS 101060]|uniref:Type 2A phosphatase-associated protein 42 n=1 Tax=Patellaria atrata CBS 101060 TaxID=1346257 RepID=A0A9P4S9N6_9PEZI|nr:type 2A phosphatase-associated protein 42 [Patellaria atrata CBS 101060]